MDSSSAATSENFTFRHGQGVRRGHNNPQAQAAVLVPAGQNSTQHLRDAIRSIINALDEWEGSTAAEDLYPCQQHQNRPSGEVQNHTLAVLEQVLSKLSPQDAAMVRTFVDAKLTPPGEPSQCHFQSAEPSPHIPALLPQVAPLASVSPESSNSKEPATMMRQQSAAVGSSGNHGVRQGAKPVERSFRANLRELTQFDNAQVLMLRRVSFLGLNSQALLEAYFAQFGDVERVMVCRTRSKSVPGARMRMAGVAFLVMRQTKDVDGILAYGPEHVVQGTIVTVGPYGTRELADVVGLQT